MSTTSPSKSDEIAPQSATASALTLRAAAVSLLVILLAGVVGQLSGVFDSANTLIGVEALSVPALLVFWPLAVVVACVGALSRTQLLSRAELLVVLLASLVATPLMTVGFWRFQLAGLSTVVRASDWNKFEALPEGLWPHGPNLLAGALERRAPSVTPSGAASLGASRAKIVGRDPSGVASVRVRVDLGAAESPLHGDRAAVAVPGRPYLFTVRLRAQGLGPGAHYFVRTYADDSPTFSAELVNARGEAKPSPLFPDGFSRVGYYPLELPRAARRSVLFELGLQGEGTVEWEDLRLYDVSAIELGFKGYTRVTAEEHGKLSLAERQSCVLVPDSPFSGAGLRYLLGLDYPLSDWLSPIARLGTLALLLFASTLALSLVYRKQWLETERYGVPLLRPLLVLLGADEARGGLGERYYRNVWLWLGFGLALAWCAVKVLHGYVPSLPDLSVSVGLKSYLPGAFWGHTWDDVKLELFALYFGLGLLLELNVLLSLVLGFLLGRAQYWFGEAYGLSSDTSFPYHQHQMLGAYLAYALCVVVFTRRYLLAAAKNALLGQRGDGEASSQRSAWLLLCGSAVGFLLWSRWVGIPLVATALLSLQLVLFGWIAAKLMAECGLPRAGFNHPLGLPGNYNVPVEPMLLVPLLGGLSVFGGPGMMVLTLVTATVIPYGFFLIPGLQVYGLELGRRFGLSARQIGLVTLLAAATGIVIGGWLYLTAMYGYGASRFPDSGMFGDRLGAFRGFNAELAAAQSAMANPGSAAGGGAAERARLLALGFGAIATGLVTVARQIFPGFWFHPVGLLVGPSDMLQNMWGSFLVAWLVRLSVLRLGGAATVREKLVPIAVGIFLGALVGHALYVAGNAYWFFFNKGSVKFGGLL